MLHTIHNVARSLCPSGSPSVCLSVSQSTMWSVTKLLLAAVFLLLSFEHIIPLAEHHRRSIGLPLYRQVIVLVWSRLFVSLYRPCQFTWHVSVFLSVCHTVQTYAPIHIESPCLSQQLKSTTSSITQSLYASCS